MYEVRLGKVDKARKGFSINPVRVQQCCHGTVCIKKGKQLQI